MAYTKHEWECGETITAESLNNIEDGIEEALQSVGGSASEPLIIRFTGETVEESSIFGNVTYYLTDTTLSNVQEATADGRFVWLYGQHDAPNSSDKELVFSVYEYMVGTINYRLGIKSGVLAFEKIGGDE